MLAYYAFFAVASVAISVAYLLVWRGHFNALLSIIHIVIPLVCVAAFGRATCATIEAALLCHNLVCIFGAFVTPVVAFGVAQLLGYKFKYRTFFLAILIQIAIYASLITNEYTNLYMTVYGLDAEYGVAILARDFGPASFAMIASIAVYTVITIILMAHSLFSMKTWTVSKAALRFALVMIISLLVLYIALEIHFKSTQIGVFYFVGLQLAMFVLNKSAANSYIEPYAYDVLGGEDGIGVVSFDSSHRVMVRSSRSIELFPELAELRYHAPIGDAEGFNARLRGWVDRLAETGEPFSVIEERDGRSIKLSFSVRTIDDQVRYCCYMSDDTAQQDLLRIMGDDVEQVRASLSKYVDPNLMSAMLGQTEIARDGKECTVAVMFADIRGYSAVSEYLDSRETIRILNKYLTLAEQAVHRNGGILDKYIGDAAMAFWVDSAGDGAAARQAARAALEIKGSIVEIEDEVYAEVGSELFYGIGLGYGPAVFGNIGSDEQSGLTVIGDTVNMAARLEGLAPKNAIYATRAFCDAAGGAFACERRLQGVKVKGRASLIDIYEVVAEAPGPGAPEGRRAPAAVPAAGGPRAILHVCGCRGSYSVSGERFSQFGGQTTCYVLKRGSHAVVIDCGTGLSNAAPILRDCDRIDVLLTHMHYDHCIGLLNWGVFPRGVPLTFYGNFSRWGGDDAIRGLFRHPYWPVDMFRGEMVDIGVRPAVELAPGLTARFLEASHPNDSKLILFEVDGKRLCIMGDNESEDAVPGEVLGGVDCLVYDGMYDDAEYPQYVGWGHSTWQGAVRVARRNGVGLLVVSHHDIGCSDAVLIDRERRAQEDFPPTVFARIGDRYEL